MVFMKKNDADWLHREFGVKKIAGLRRFSNTVFYPAGFDEGIGVSAAKARDIIEKLGGSKNFEFRTIKNRRLILRVKDRKIDLKDLHKISGDSIEKWTKKSKVKIKKGSLPLVS